MPLKWGNCWCGAASLNNYKAHRKSGRRGTKQRRGKVRMGPERRSRVFGELHVQSAPCRGRQSRSAESPFADLDQKLGETLRFYCGKSLLKETLWEFHLLMLLSSSAVQSVIDCMGFTRCPIRSLHCDSLLDRVSLRDNC